MPSTRAIFTGLILLASNIGISSATSFTLNNYIGGGGVVLGSETFAAVTPRFLLREIPAHRLRGMTEYMLTFTMAVVGVHLR